MDSKQRKQAPGDPGPGPTSYAEARGRLDRILRQLEEGEVEVDLLAERLEEAARLVGFCRTRLRDQEIRLREVATELAAEAGEELEEKGGSEEEE